MKGVVIIALFAFVAVQLCHSAPMPDEEKKEETPSPSPAPEASSQLPTENVEVKSELPTSGAPAQVTVKEEKKP